MTTNTYRNPGYIRVQWPWIGMIYKVSCVVITMYNIQWIRISIMDEDVWYTLEIMELMSKWVNYGLIILTYHIYSSTMEILIYCISLAILEIMVLCISSSWRFWSIYIVRGDDHICHILYHAYSWPLYSYVSGTVVDFWSYANIIIPYCWMAGSSTRFFITPLMGWTYNVFRPSYHPCDLTH